MIDSIRETLQGAQKLAADQVTRTQFGAYRRLDKAITEALAQLSDMERDREAMRGGLENSDVTLDWLLERTQKNIDAILGTEGDSE